MCSENGPASAEYPSQGVPELHYRETDQAETPMKDQQVKGRQGLALCRGRSWPRLGLAVLRGCFCPAEARPGGTGRSGCREGRPKGPEGARQKEGYGEVTQGPSGAPAGRPQLVLGRACWLSDLPTFQGMKPPGAPAVGQSHGRAAGAGPCDPTTGSSPERPLGLAALRRRDPISGLEAARPSTLSGVCPLMQPPESPDTC